MAFDCSGHALRVCQRRSSVVERVGERIAADEMGRCVGVVEGLSDGRRSLARRLELNWPTRFIVLVTCECC